MVRRHQFSARLLCTAGLQQGKNRLVPLRTGLDRRTNGARRRREGIRKATDVLVEMVAEAVASGIKASHLLFDRWFAFPATMRKLLAKGVHTNQQGPLNSWDPVSRMLRRTPTGDLR